MNATFEDEVLRRLRRMETKLHKWGENLGLEPDLSNTPLRAEEHRDRYIVFVPGHDVTISQVKRAVVALGPVKPRIPVYLVHADAAIACVYLTE